VNATFTGLHALDHRLPDWSPEARAQDAAEMRTLRAKLIETSTPSRHEYRTNAMALDAELACANLDVRLLEHESGFFHARNPALWTGEAIFSVVALMIRDFAPAHERLSAMQSRLDAIPAFLGAMERAITSPIPALWMARAQRECAAADGLLDRGLRAWLSAEHIGAYASDAVMRAADHARRAFADAAAWLSTRTAAPDADYAIGETAFTTLLRRGHFSDATPRELLASALAELPREQARLAEMTAATGRTWENVQSTLADDHPSVDAYYDAFTAQWTTCRAITEAHDAVTWPDWPIRYVPIPEWAQEFAPQLYWLFYRSPAPFDPYTEYEYVVTPIDASMPETEQLKRLRAWNRSTITLNHVVHHGAVGHHVQNWHARHRSTSRIGTIAAVDCASRIGMFLGGSMAEGWACYATQLMEELGMLTPLEQISEQHTRVRMLARAIVDIRLHLGLITFGEAVAYYQSVVGMSVEVATAETTKNSMFPCTALMYWLGTSGILALRDTVKQARGDDFSLRAFHDELLGRGAIPVALAASLMTETLS
jgi:uncharacterized protein (DUF885 family)